MFKIAFATDIHLRYTAPISRLDDDSYHINIINKIKYIIDFANSNCDMIIFGGDLFDKPDIPYSLLINLIKELKKSKKPIYSIVGNHDIYGYNNDSVNKSAIGILFENNLIKKLDEIVINNIRIKGIHCFSDLILDDIKEDLINIAVVHKPISIHNIPNTIKLSDVEKNNLYNIVLCGDIHTPFEHISHNAIWLNPGSLSRTSIIDKDRDVKFLYISIDNKLIEYKEIIVPYKKDVFSVNYDINNDSKDFVTSYANIIYEIKDKEKSVVDYLRNFFKINNIDNEIVEIINYYIQKAEGIDEKSLNKKDDEQEGE